MTTATHHDPETDTKQLVARIAATVGERGLRVATAESLTSGAIASALGAGESASEWFAGGVIGYIDDAKFRVLGVTPGPVITERCATEMAVGVRRLFQADIAVSVTGVGGPGPEEGREAGTVFIAACDAASVSVREYHFSGGPEEILARTAAAALRLLLEHLPAERPRD